MKREKKQIKTSADVIDAVKHESITCADLLYQLKKFPELINSSELFAISCGTLKLEYVEAFLHAGISREAIKKSNYQKNLLDACKIAPNTQNYAMQKAAAQIVGEMHKNIDSAIKNYVDNHTKRNKRG